jgi:hypothetical protein
MFSNTPNLTILARLVNKNCDLQIAISCQPFPIRLGFNSGLKLALIGVDRQDGQEKKCGKLGLIGFVFLPKASFWCKIGGNWVCFAKLSFFVRAALRGARSVSRISSLVSRGLWVVICGSVVIVRDSSLVARDSYLKYCASAVILTSP